MRKQDLISEKIYQMLSSTGAQQTRFYGLAKGHKKDTPLHTFLSFPGSPYQKLNKFLTPLFQRVPGENIETSWCPARVKLEKIEVQKNRQVFSLNLKNLDTNVPASKANEIAL